MLAGRAASALRDALNGPNQRPSVMASPFATGRPPGPRQSGGDRRAGLARRGGGKIAAL